MRSRAKLLPLLAALGGCSAPAVVVAVDNPQALPVAREHVRADWIGDGGATRSITHDFAVNGNLGTFAIELAHVGRGRLRVSVELDDATGAEVGRATGSLTLTGQTRANLRLRATRLLAHPHATLLAGVPGGAGDRDGATGADPLLPGRLDRPIAFAVAGRTAVNGAIALILEACGSIRRLAPRLNAATKLDRILPCSRHAPPAASGSFADLSLDDPANIVYDTDHGTAYIGDGARVLAVPFPQVDLDPAALSYFDFSAASGMPPMHVADLALGPYRQGRSGPQIDTLYVADDVANVVWAYPIAGGAPTIAVGQRGPCVTTLADVEKAHPPMGGGSWAPGPFIAPSTAHLCAPSRIDTGSFGATGSDPVLFVSDNGHGNVRMVAPRALLGAPGVTTLFDGFPRLQAIGYRFLGSNVVIAGTDIGALFFWNQNQLSYFMLYSNPTIAGVGSASPITSSPTPGFTDGFNVLSALGAAIMGRPLDVRFDGVAHSYRVSDQGQGDAVVSRAFMMFAERGGSVIKNVDLNLNVTPWVGAGPHLGLDAASNGTEVPLFAAPTGLAWNGSDTLFVADRDNDAVAAVRYDGSVTPVKGVQSAPLVGCPRTPGDVDGPAAQALVRQPLAVAFDAARSALWVLDRRGSAVRRLQLDGSGAPLEVHTLFGSDANDGARCVPIADGGPPPPDVITDGGLGPPGLLGTASSMVLDEVRRALWLAHADSADLVLVNLDVPSSTPKLVALPEGVGPGARLAIVDATLFAVGVNGGLGGIDLLASAPVAVSLPTIPLAGAVTAVGSDGEWLYVADAGAEVWRVDPLSLSSPPALLLGDGAHGLLIGDNPGVNRVGGFAYDGARGILMLSDTVENSVVAIQ